MPCVEEYPETASQLITELRRAIQTNRLTFPMPVPAFSGEYRADIQWRLAELYFVHSWSPSQLAGRYGISCSRVRQSLRGWVRRAKAFGYLQPIPSLDSIPVVSPLPEIQNRFGPSMLLPAEVTGWLTPVVQLHQPHA